MYLLILQISQTDHNIHDHFFLLTQDGLYKTNDRNIGTQHAQWPSRLQNILSISLECQHFSPYSNYRTVT